MVREDLKHLVSLALELWPGYTSEDLTADFADIYAKEDSIAFVVRIINIFYEVPMSSG